MRDRKAVARYASLTGSPDESGAKRREQGLAKAGNIARFGEPLLPPLRAALVRRACQAGVARHRFAITHWPREHLMDRTAENGQLEKN